MDGGSIFEILVELFVDVVIFLDIDVLVIGDLSWIYWVYVIGNGCFFFYFNWVEVVVFISSN